MCSPSARAVEGNMDTSDVGSDSQQISSVAQLARAARQAVRSCMCHSGRQQVSLTSKESKDSRKRRDDLSYWIETETRKRKGASY